MAIPHTARGLKSYIAGMLVDDGPKRVKSVLLKYTLDAKGDENFATPSRATTYNGNEETVAPGGTGRFAGFIVGNMRVPSNERASWYQNGDVIEVMEMGRIAVNIDSTDHNPSSGASEGGKVYFDQTSGKILAGNSDGAAGQDGDITEIPNAMIDALGPDDADPRLAVVVITGPVPV